MIMTMIMIIIKIKMITTRWNNWSPGQSSRRGRNQLIESAQRKKLSFLEEPSSSIFKTFCIWIVENEIEKVCFFYSNIENSTRPLFLLYVRNLTISKNMKITWNNVELGKTFIGVIPLKKHAA